MISSAIEGGRGHAGLPAMFGGGVANRAGRAKITEVNRGASETDRHRHRYCRLRACRPSVRPKTKPAFRESARSLSEPTRGVSIHGGSRQAMASTVSLLPTIPARTLARSVDRDEALGGLDMPEGPAVVSFEPLRQCAERRIELTVPPV